jgi:hypothetical protein
MVSVSEQGLLPFTWTPETLFKISQTASAPLSIEGGFWRQWVDGYLSELCKRPDTKKGAWPSTPSQETAQSFVMGAPEDLPGYPALSVNRVLHLWSAMDVWVKGKIKEMGSRVAFLERYAPDWKEVGRLTFHLTEYRASETQCIGWLATATRLEHAGHPVRNRSAINGFRSLRIVDGDHSTSLDCEVRSASSACRSAVTPAAIES